MNKPKKDSYESGYCAVTDTLDVNVGYGSPADKVVVVTHYPHPKESHQHWHINLSYKEAKKLHKFLESYINEVYSYHE